MPANCRRNLNCDETLTPLPLSKLRATSASQGGVAFLSSELAVVQLQEILRKFWTFGAGVTGDVIVGGLSVWAAATLQPQMDPAI